MLTVELPYCQRRINKVFKIEDNIIYLTRGDTAYIDLKIDGYKLKENDFIIFTVKKDLDDEPLIEKQFTDTFILYPEDTSFLEYGKYYFDCELRTALGEVFTVVPKSYLYLKEEVSL